MAIETTERRDCNDSALFCHGTGYIFEQRLISLRVANKILLFSSLAGPLAIGALVISVGTEGKIVVWAMTVASVLSAVQVIVTLWSVVAEWLHKVAVYEESMVENYFLASEYKRLADATNLTDAKWRSDHRVLESRGDIRRREDLKLGVSEEERRMGMRYALRFFSRPCAGVNCKKIPESVLPQKDEKCDVCANFKTRRYKWLT